MSTLVLLSGGLDSAVLAAHEAQTARVLPVYVSVGLAWEDAEVAMVEQLLASPAYVGKVEPLARMSFTMRDVYSPTHWAIRGVPPAYDTPDEDVYLIGRNLVLLTKAGVVAAKAKARRIALGPLAGNPFPDARPAFFSTMEQALTLGLDHRIEIAAPFLHLEKEDVIKRGVALQVPFELTLSCMNPVPGSRLPAPGVMPQHCGLCSKCRERRDAFAAADVPDPSHYANRSPR
ncbi:MAG: 7-cyano-7-deazaguanine synthase [Cyanobacteria bacterium]|nr:7-cyano-7-deazaguanine synthase [Cyanobacteriota bacterium]